MSFLRSTMVMKPCSSLVPRSPLRNQPSTMAAAVVLRPAEVAGEDVVAADDDLAELAGRQQLDPVVELGPGDLHLDAPDRVADRAGLGPEVRAGWWWPSARSRTARTPRRWSASNAALNRSSTATGSEAPPEMHSRRRGSCVVAAAAASSSPTYIVGTPWKTLTFSRSIRSIAASTGEPGQQHQRAAEAEGAVHADGLAERVEQRQAAEHDVVRRGVVGVEHVDRGVHAPG